MKKAAGTAAQALDKRIAFSALCTTVGGVETNVTASWVSFKVQSMGVGTSNRAYRW